MTSDLKESLEDVSIRDTKQHTLQLLIQTTFDRELSFTHIDESSESNDFALTRADSQRDSRMGRPLHHWQNGVGEGTQCIPSDFE